MGSSCCTNSVVATCVVFVPSAAVGAVGVPDNAGEASGAFAARSVVRFVTADCAIAISVADADVILPFASIAMVGTALADPYVAADTPEFARVREIDVVPDPVASPDTVIVSLLTVPHDVVVPSVVRYFPEFPVWVGSGIRGVGVDVVGVP